MPLQNIAEARFVSQFARNHARHIRHNMERDFGPGLSKLYHPVTHEFNHAAVIERRGGRRPEEVIGTEKSLGIHQAFSYAHGLFGAAYPDKNRVKHSYHPKVKQDDFGSEESVAEADNSLGQDGPADADPEPADADPETPVEEEDDYPKLWMKLGDKTIDTYSWVSILYGWSKGIMKNPFTEDAIVSSCFLGLFDLVTEFDFFIQDVSVVDKTLNFYDMFVYYPARLFKGFDNVYE